MEWLGGGCCGQIVGDPMGKKFNQANHTKKNRIGGKTTLEGGKISRFNQKRVCSAG